MSDEQKPGGSPPAGGDGGGGGGGGGRRRHFRHRRRKSSGEAGAAGGQPVTKEEPGGDARPEPQGRPSEPPRRGPERGGRQQQQRPPEREGQRRGQEHGDRDRRPQGSGRPGAPRRNSHVPQTGEGNRIRQPGQPQPDPDAYAPPADGEIAYAEPEGGGVWGRDEGDVGDGRADYSTLGPERIEYLKPHETDESILLDDLPEAPLDASGALMDVVGIKLYDAGVVTEYDSQDLLLALGEQVIVETGRGLAFGQVMIPTTRRRQRNDKLPRVIRKATHNDMRQRERNFVKERAAFVLCQDAISTLHLDMKLIRVDYLHGGNKAVFFFASEGRVDFRELVRELARRLHIRVEMRQIGVRDAARMFGGIGTCGQRLCCNRYIREFQTVSIRMAKDQDLVLNPEKVSGLCGRLMCCLAYEDQVYREAARSMPRVGRRVMTPNGEGRVKDRDVLKRVVRVQLVDEAGLVEFPIDKISPVGAVEKAAEAEPEPEPGPEEELPDVPEDPPAGDGAAEP
jgi:cell fate regulator YaaT (PSP1 superfamily)